MLAQLQKMLWGSRNSVAPLGVGEAFVVTVLGLRWGGAHHGLELLQKCLLMSEGLAVVHHMGLLGCVLYLVRIATWLILPVVIRSSQRLSHARLSINLLL